MEEHKIKEIVEELPQYRTNKISNEIAIRITNVFPELKESYEELLKKLEKCNIKIAKFQDENITHYYENNTIYFSDTIYLNAINQELILGYLSYLKNDNKNNYFINALHNYIAKLLMQDLKERMNVHEIFISSLIEGDYALAVNIIMQIDFLVGRNSYIKTLIFKNNEYFEILDSAFTGNFERIQKEISKFIFLEQEYKTTDDMYGIEKEIQENYFELQNFIMKTYFNKKVLEVDNIDDIKKLREKLDEIQNLRGFIEEDKFYEEQKDKITNKLNSIEKKISKVKSKKALAIIYNNKIFKFLKSLLSFGN